MSLFHFLDSSVKLFSFDVLCWECGSLFSSPPFTGPLYSSQHFTLIVSLLHHNHLSSSTCYMQSFWFAFEFSLYL